MCLLYSGSERGHGRRVGGDEGEKGC